MKRLTALLASIVIGSAVAAPATSQSASESATPISSAVHSFNAKSVVESVKDTPISGLKQVQADKQIIYFSPDGKYLFAGDIFEVATKKNLTEEARGELRVALLKSSPQKDHVVFGKPDNAKKIYVFTDTTCAYCQRFHKEVPKLVAAGVTVEFLAWPRSGPKGPGYEQLQSVWCSPDRAAAYDAVMTGKEVAPAKCDSDLVKQQFALGEQLDVGGTPAIFSSNGVQLGGYVTAERVLKSLGMVTAKPTK